MERRPDDRRLRLRRRRDAIPRSRPLPALGLDFGTTNTVVASCGPGEEARPVTYRTADRELAAFRSALTFWDEGEEGAHQVRWEAGPWAIRQFLEAPGETRFIQSLKSFAASRIFESTAIFGRAWRFEDLFNAFFASLRGHAGGQLATLPRDVVVGRPVQYVGSRPDARLARERYEKALAPFGFERMRQVYEPVAAAFFFARKLTGHATVLVADFGGGTTDFSVIAFRREKGELRAEALGHSGVGVAGDRFDYRIIDRVVLPQLGKGSTYRSMGKRLEMPRSCFNGFASWHELSIMKGSRSFRELKELMPFSDEPELLQRFVRLVEHDQGYRLYRAVSDAKEALSSADVAQLRFEQEGLHLEATITRAEFESWIEEELAAIEAALDEVLVNAAIAASDVDRVFLTGGSSFVPAVRRIFERRFGAARIESGDEFTSIANGLATIGQREDIAAWTVAA